MMKNKYIKLSLIIFLSVVLILFTQAIKLVKDPGSTPITWMTIAGLIVLWGFSMIGIFISDIAQKAPFQWVRDFPILGWVSVTSLVGCMFVDFFVEAIAAVDFLAITTPILTFAGISVVDRLVELRRTSWKVAIVAIFVFAGTYIGSALLAQFGLMVTGN